MTEDSLDVGFQSLKVALGIDRSVAPQLPMSNVFVHQVDLKSVLPGPLKDVGQGMGFGAGEEVMPFRARSLWVPHGSAEPDAHQDEPHPQTVLDKAGAKDQEPGLLGVGEGAFDPPAQRVLPTPIQARRESADPRSESPRGGHRAAGLDRLHIPRRVSF